jgi:para-aminobenzoate synthetase component I
MHASELAVSATPLVEELTLPPWQAFQATAKQRFPLFLDSALKHRSLGRYSYMTADPFALIRSRGTQVEWLRHPDWSPPESADPFQTLSEALIRFRTAPLPELPPFQGGAAGLFGYDLCHHLERLPRARIDEFAVPDMAVGFYDWVYAYDQMEERGWLISTGFPELEPVRRHARATARLADAKRWLAAPTGNEQWVPRGSTVSATCRSAIEPAVRHPLPLLPELGSSFRRQDFLNTIRRAIEYVHAGDCFQVNIAQRLLYPLREHPAEIYCKLRQRNPATFAGYFDMGDFVVASASPERFLRLGADGQVETRPIKGTRPRGKTADADRHNRDELEQSAKDRAENIMIVDLLRNDLGRVCEYGSVEVPELCRVETYETVHHLVSVVRGQLRRDKSAVDLLRAAFPGGSVTGAPKIRAMEIIAELEPTARGPYCGSLGYIGFNGAMDTSILIRTFTIGKGWVQFPVGGGIVADSEPENEYEETLHKAAGMLRALE